MKGLLITALLSMFALVGCGDNVASANYYDEFKEQETYNSSNTYWSLNIGYVCDEYNLQETEYDIGPIDVYYSIYQSCGADELVSLYFVDIGKVKTGLSNIFNDEYMVEDMLKTAINNDSYFKIFSDSRKYVFIRKMPQFRM